MKELFYIGVISCHGSVYDSWFRCIIWHTHFNDFKFKTEYDSVLCLDQTKQVPMYVMGTIYPNVKLIVYDMTGINWDNKYRNSVINYRTDLESFTCFV